MSGGAKTLRVFAYGSLMYEPECPELVAGMQTAVLPGFRRWFNKRSVPRGCADDEALVGPGLPGWVDGGRRVSLALGTRVGGAMHGRVVTWRGSAPELARVLAALDRREGVSGDAGDGYLRRRLPVEVAGREEEVVTYLTNLGGPLHAELEAEGAAEVLVRATPREVGGRARGADYLAGAWRVLREVGVEDVALAGLVEVVRGKLPAGRWRG